MVLESFLAKIVNKFCSRFVKDFKKEVLANLTISLSGDVCLSNFELKTDEIKDLQLPVELKTFAVGKLHVNIPLTHLSSQPIKVELLDVNVLLGTPRDPKWDVDSLYVSEQSKIFLFQLLLELFVPTPIAGATAHGPPKTSAPILTPSVVAILRNASVTIERIHVRFEDGLSGLALETPTQFALGVTLGSVTILPSTQTVGSSDHVKTAKLKDLAVYFKQDRMLEDLPVAEQRAAFRMPFEPAPPTAPNASPYLLEPLSCEVSLQMSMPVGADGAVRPSHVGIKLLVPDVRVNIAHAHYSYLECFLDGVERFNRYTLYRPFRPVDGGKGKKDWRAFWRYAIAAVLIDLNDPASRRPTWRSTLNLVLVGLQYTAIRRKVLPFLIRQPTDSDHHFLQYREDFVHNSRQGIAPYDHGLSPSAGKLPVHVTAFGEGIYAGVYGLARAFPGIVATPTDAGTAGGTRPPEPVTPALSTAEAEAKELWHRQLCIDAMFRPTVAAKLRLLATRQVDHKAHRITAAAKDHNELKGSLTVTLVDATGIPKGMHLFPKLHVGRKGTAYTGGLVESEPPADGAKTTNVLFSQTFEFQLSGTPNEGNVHIQLYDRWPLFNQFVGKLRLPVAKLTSEPHTDGTYPIEAADKKSAGLQLRVLTVFHAGAKPAATAPYKTSMVMMETLFPEQFAKKSHEWHSWYATETTTSLQTVSATALVASVKVAFVFPKVSKKGQLDHIMLALDKVRYQLIAYPMQAAVKQAFSVARLDVFHFMSFDTAHKQFIQGPKVAAGPTVTPFLQFESSHAPREPLQAKLRTSEMEIILDIPVVFRHMLAVVQKLPEITAFLAHIGGPVYAALLAYTDGAPVVAPRTEPTSPRAVVPVPTSTPARASEATSAPVQRTGSFFGSFKKLFDDDAKPDALPPLATSSVFDDKDRSDEVSMTVDVGAVTVAIPCVSDGEKHAGERILEVIMPSTKLHIRGGRGRPMEILSNDKVTLVKTTRDAVWALGQFEKIGMVLAQQLTRDTQPFYTKDMASKVKVLRFEQKIQSLEQQLAKYRCVIRQVLATPERYRIEAGDCDPLRLIVRDMQPKVVSATPSIIPAYTALLQQGVTLLKHHVHSGEPQWRLVWTTEAHLNIAKLTDRKKPSVFDLKSITSVTAGEMTKAFSRKGSEKDAAKYFAIAFKAKDEPVSFECQSDAACSHLVAALQSLLV
ncbi:hypothetical protein ACHHYP_12779 [Achlya hypogyna]|uniref:C2 domain-containing protein n=1 Tax=Achlya hypogyna TaxID=1202772 RepID=A0A1V9YGG9_ACHHY|nr:hypothetical protein ACHHYP_12779 [Achlya hypogyna]